MIPQTESDRENQRICDIFRKIRRENADKP